MKELLPMIEDAIMDESEAIEFYSDMIYLLKEIAPDLVHKVEKIYKDERDHLRILQGLHETLTGTEDINMIKR